MALPLLKRVLLSLAVLFWLCILLSGTFHTSTSRYPNTTKFREPHLRVPIVDPFPNASNLHFQLDDQVQESKLYSASFSDTHYKTTPKIPHGLFRLTECPRSPNRFTNHIRLPHLLYNISMVPKHATYEEPRRFWNPTILALPSWAKNQYLILSMVLLKDQGFRENVLCEANICIPNSQRNEGTLNTICSDQDLELLGPNGGLRCVSPPVEVRVPATPAQECSGLEKGLADIPGFHG